MTTRYIPSAISTAQAEARRAGQHTFQVNEPCKHGHTAARFTSNKCCTACVSEANNKPKPPNERKLRLSSKETKPVLVQEDEVTAKLMDYSCKRFHEITDKPVSKSVIHKASMVLLANYLNGNLSPTELRALIR